jgi:hypothetical protein
MMGSFIVHPRDSKFMPVDRDFVFLLATYAIEPGTYTPKVVEMTDFTHWTFNSRVFPAIDHLAVRKGDRVRVRVGNLTMTAHPIHMHGYHFSVTCTDGGWVPETARWPETTIDVPVGAMRAYEFVADEPGDWALHCHKSHHTMNAMGHNVRTYVGVDQRQIRDRINGLVGGDYMPMGSQGMAEMGEMEMAAPDNTLPMMPGFGQFGAMEMGGMFTVVKVREGLAPGDYKDPDWYQHPQGTVAYEAQGTPPSPASAPDQAPAKGAAAQPKRGNTPARKTGHH